MLEQPADPAPGAVDPYKIAVLDPGTATNLGGGHLLPTAYVRDRLLLRGFPGRFGADLARIQTALDAAGVPVRVRAEDVDAVQGSVLDRLDGPDRELLDEIWVTTVTVTATVTDYVVDAQAVRAALVRADETLGAVVSLDHVLFGTAGGPGSGPTGGVWPGIGGVWPGIGGVWPGIGGVWPGIGGPGEYGLPGRGGRMPVRLLCPDPARTAPDPVRPVVVAVPDTGVGQHPWFDADPTVVVGADYHGVSIGGANADLGDGVADPLTGTMAPLAGHGTFIAGLVRQGCPRASILSIPVMSPAGTADEGFVRRSLALLLLRHVEAVRAGAAEGAIDVLSISMGYYHEAGDGTADDGFRRLFEAYGRHGVLVAAGAGNDATTRVFLPAGFAADPVPPDGLPLVSVGALNPDGSTIALFSNGGTWVRTYRSGAAVVSTLPCTFDSGAPGTQVGEEDHGRPQARLTPDGHAVRATIDPDSYRSGFGVWSGTSFSAPVLAAELAAALVADDRTTKAKRVDRVARARRALDTVLQATP